MVRIPPLLLHFPPPVFFSKSSLGHRGGLLAYGLRQLDGVGGRPGWSWIFIIEGLLTLVCAIPGWWLIPDFPEDSAKWLSSREREQWQARLRRSQGLTGTPVPFTRAQVTRAFSDWRTYAYALM